MSRLMLVQKDADPTNFHPELTHKMNFRPIWGHIWKVVFIDFVLKSGQTTITVTCALKNQYENLPDWLGKYVGMNKKIRGGIQFFITLWSIMFLGDICR